MNVKFITALQIIAIAVSLGLLGISVIFYMDGGSSNLTWVLRQ